VTWNPQEGAPPDEPGLLVLVDDFIGVQDGIQPEEHRRASDFHRAVLERMASSSSNANGPIFVVGTRWPMMLRDYLAGYVEGGLAPCPGIVFAMRASTQRDLVSWRWWNGLLWERKALLLEHTGPMDLSELLALHPGLWKPLPDEERPKLDWIVARQNPDPRSQRLTGGQWNDWLGQAAAAGIPIELIGGGTCPARVGRPPWAAWCSATTSPGEEGLHAG